MSTAKQKDVLAAEMVEGPYYGNGSPPRSDIRGDRPGLELALEIQLLDVRTSGPLADLNVDLWHPDATGHYSGYDYDPDLQPENVAKQKPMNDEIFLRGVQTSSSDGVVRFTKIYPGWYASRAPHMHLKVFSGDTCVLTTQLYFPEAISEQVYATPDYKRTVEQDTRNATDTVIALAQSPIDACWIELTRTSAGLDGSCALGIDLEAVSTPMDPPPGFRPPLGGVPHDKSVR